MSRRLVTPQQRAMLMAASSPASLKSDLRNFAIGFGVLVVLALAGVGYMRSGHQGARGGEDAATLRGSSGVPVETDQAWRSALMETINAMQSASRPCLKTAEELEVARRNVVATGSLTELRALANRGKQMCREAELALDVLAIPSGLPGSVAEPLGQAKLMCSLAMMRLGEVHRSLAAAEFETMSAADGRAYWDAWALLVNAYTERQTECVQQVNATGSAVVAFGPAL